MENEPTERIKITLYDLSRNQVASGTFRRSSPRPEVVTWKGRTFINNEWQHPEVYYETIPARLDWDWGK